MNVWIQVLHPPHEYSVITALPEIDFVVSGWNGALRPLPANAKIRVPPDGLDLSYDVAIFSREPIPDVKARKRVWVQHCDWWGTDSEAAALESKFTEIISVSPHKRITMKEFGLSPKVKVINHGMDPGYWKPATGGLGIGTVMNNMAIIPEVYNYCSRIAEEIPLIVIGFDNGEIKNCTHIMQNGEIFPQTFGRLDVFINVVCGDACGMTFKEAMLLGIPMVSGRFSDAGAFCLSGWNCYMADVPPLQCIPWVIEKAKELNANEDLRRSMGKAARNTIETLFPFKRFADEWRKVLTG